MVISMKKWKSKVAIVTGASSGIGVSIVELLVENGVIVVGVGRRVDRIQAQADKFTKQKLPGKLHPFKADFCKEEDILKTFEWTSKNVGPVHILVNNAGYMKIEPLFEGNTETWRNVFDLNVLGLSIATREAIKVMRENNIDGHIVHINSIAGHKIPVGAKSNVYAASKHAVTALTETLRQELARLGSKIKVSSVSPGLVSTEMTTLNPANAATNTFAERPVLDPKDIADGVIFVLSTPAHVQVHELTIKPLGEPY